MKSLTTLVNSAGKLLKKASGSAITRVSLALGMIALPGLEARANPFDLNKWLSVEFEPLRAGFRLGDQPQITIGDIPGYLRDIDTHPNDPYVDLAPLPNNQFKIDYETNLVDAFNFKCFLFGIVGGGIGLRGSPIRLEHEGVQYFGSGFNGEYYDYSHFYGPSWGAAYTMYQVYAETDDSAFRIFLEARTPPLKIGEKTSLIGLCVYDPKVSKMEVFASNGYFRFGGVQLKDTYQLAETKFGRLAFEGQLQYGEDPFYLTFSAGYSKYLMDETITPAGDDFGINIEKPKGEIVVSGSIMCRF
jgi:hypothetical protein